MFRISWVLPPFLTPRVFVSCHRFCLWSAFPQTFSGPLMLLSFTFQIFSTRSFLSHSPTILDYKTFMLTFLSVMLCMIGWRHFDVNDNKLHDALTFSRPYTWLPNFSSDTWLLFHLSHNRPFFSSQGVAMVRVIVFRRTNLFRNFCWFFSCIPSYCNSGLMLNHFSESLSLEPGVLSINTFILSVNTLPNQQQLTNISLKYEYTFNQSFLGISLAVGSTLELLLSDPLAGFHIQSNFSHVSQSNNSFLFQQYNCLITILNKANANRHDNLEGKNLTGPSLREKAFILIRNEPPIPSGQHWK